MERAKTVLKKTLVGQDESLAQLQSEYDAFMKSAKELSVAIETLKTQRREILEGLELLEKGVSNEPKRKNKKA